MPYLSPGRPGDTLFKASPQKPQSGARGADPPVVQSNRRDVRQSKARFADYVCWWDFDIIESKLGQTGGTESNQIMNGFHFETRSFPRHQTCQRAVSQFSKHQK